jgi:hypothetical protein
MQQVEDKCKEMEVKYDLHQETMTKEQADEREEIEVKAALKRRYASSGDLMENGITKKKKDNLKTFSNLLQ